MHRLKNSGMLAIDGNDGGSRPLGQRHQQRSSDHQRLFVRQSDAATQFHGTHRSLQGTGSDHRTNDAITGHRLDQVNEPFVAVENDRCVIECSLHRRHVAPLGDRNRMGMESVRLFGEFVTP